jgi:hypothetical protein
MARMTFEKISTRRVLRWTDPETGKPRQETKEFSQTLNPFNQTAGGQPKTREQIWTEINRQADLWLLREQNDMRQAAQTGALK